MEKNAKKRSILLILPLETVEKLEKIVELDNTGLTISQVIRIAINKYLNK